MARVALITGCSTGIGSATAAAFADAGWRVVATMRDPVAGAELAARDNVTVARLDVTDPPSIAAAMDGAVAAHGGIDVLVNNAGLGLASAFETSPPELVERQFATNTLGVMNCVRAVLPTMRAAGHGVIVNVTSIGGITTMPLNSVYHAAKFAVDGFSEALRYELDPLGITVKVVAPGGVRTPFGATATGSVVGIDQGAYADTTAKVLAAFAGRSGGGSAPDDVAAVILRAATDGTPQLRYLAGEDAEYLVSLRGSMPIEQYVDTMKARFGLS